jgi:hypothetical protein
MVSVLVGYYIGIKETNFELKDYDLKRSQVYMEKIDSLKIEIDNLRHEVMKKNLQLELLYSNDPNLIDVR